LWWGLVLVAGGLLLLANQFAPGLDVWRFWPLLVIAVGVRAMVAGAMRESAVKNVAEGLITVTVGAILLANSLGVITWSVWWSILSLWPLLLVAAGVDVLGKATESQWLRVLSSLVIIGGLLYGALALGSGSFRLPIVFAGESEPFAFSEPRAAGVLNGTARIDGGVGDLTIGAGGKLATAEGETPFDPRFDVSVDGSDAEVRIGVSEPWVPSGEGTRLDATLDRGVAWDLRVNAGVSSFDIDLSELRVSDLDVDAGVSGGVLTLGMPEARGSNAVSARLNTGVSTITLRVPKGASVRLTVRDGLSTHDVRGDWQTVSEGGDRIVFESQRFTNTKAYWDVDIDSGVSTVTVEYY
jgi:hypothetical protein